MPASQIDFIKFWNTYYVAKIAFPIGGYPMVRFTEEQKRIASSLFASPKTVDELNRQLNIPFDKLNGQLKHMLKLGLVKVEGYPQKYALAEEVSKGLQRRKEIAEKDPFDLRIKAVIEFKAVEEAFLEKHMKDIGEKLKKNLNYTIYDIYKAKPRKVGDHYSSYFEVNLSARDFTSIVKFMYFFGPSSVEVIKPQKVVLAMDDLQDALGEMAEMIQSYNEAMLRSMAKDELEAFAKNLYSPKAD